MQRFCRFPAPNATTPRHPEGDQSWTRPKDLPAPHLVGRITPRAVILRPGQSRTGRRSQRGDIGPSGKPGVLLHSAPRTTPRHPERVQSWTRPKDLPAPHLVVRITPRAVILRPGQSRTGRRSQRGDIGPSGKPHLAPRTTPRHPERVQSRTRPKDLSAPRPVGRGVS